MKVPTIIKLLHRIIRDGKFRHSAFDYPARRKAMLIGLEAFFPLKEAFPRKRTLKNPCLRMWFAQAAFFKHALNAKGGHLSFPEGDLAYIRIPKSASTALSDMMLKAVFPDLQQKKLTAERINLLADIHLQPEMTTRDKGITFFTVVRNPFHRIVSFYYNFFEQPQTPFIYEDYLFGIFRRDMSFRAFIQLVACIPDALKDQHLKPQHLFLRYYAHKKIAVTVVKLENEKALPMFLSRWNLTPQVINKSPEPYDYRAYYDKETLEAVYRIYRQDITEFGYDAAYEELRTSILGGAVV